MPFYPVAPDAVRNLYFAAVDTHNQATNDSDRREADVRAHAIIDVVAAIYGDVTSGMLLADADRREMARAGEEVPMCGGMILSTT